MRVHTLNSNVMILQSSAVPLNEQDNENMINLNFNKQTYLHYCTKQT